MNYKIEVFKRTTDYRFSPPYKLDTCETQLVDVSLTITEEAYRLSVWGADDMGMEREFTSENKARQTFMEIIGLEDVTVQSLIDLQFEEA